jgi:hypothetical protein
VSVSEVPAGKKNIDAAVALALGLRSGVRYRQSCGAASGGDPGDSGSHGLAHSTSQIRDDCFGALLAFAQHEPRLPAFPHRIKVRMAHEHNSDDRCWPGLTSANLTRNDG